MCNEKYLKDGYVVTLNLFNVLVSVTTEYFNKIQNNGNSEKWKRFSFRRFDHIAVTIEFVMTTTRSSKRR